jgi:CopG-like RHH_1 or ribbon-helix-helix domain, RHH_5
MATPTKRYSGKKVTVVVPLDAYESLQQIAEEEHRSVASLIVLYTLAELKRNQLLKETEQP